jgi:hypothetical protein
VLTIGNIVKRLDDDDDNDYHLIQSVTEKELLLRLVTGRDSLVRESS